MELAESDLTSSEGDDCAYLDELDWAEADRERNMNNPLNTHIARRYSYSKTESMSETSDRADVGTESEVEVVLGGPEARSLTRPKNPDGKTSPSARNSKSKQAKISNAHSNSNSNSKSNSKSKSLPTVNGEQMSPKSARMSMNA